MSAPVRALPALLLLLLLAACQPPQRPFADSKSAPAVLALRPPDSAGILVLPVDGVPPALAQKLAEALAKSLQDGDVPANTEVGNRSSYRLAATARAEGQAAGRTAVTLAWVLADAKGKPVGRHEATIEAASAAWESGDAATLSGLAARAAPEIAQLVEGDAPQAVAGTDPLVSVQPVAGAPGDGGNALVQAMGSALRRANLGVAAPADKANLLLVGRVEMSKPAAGQQHVKVSWTLSRAEGDQIGVISQENAIPAGSLDGAWGDVAYAVASAAAPGIAALIQQARRDETGS